MTAHIVKSQPSYNLRNSLKLEIPPFKSNINFHSPFYFSLNLSRIQFPTGTSLTNCNYKQGPMLACRHVHVRPHCFILTKEYLCRLELAYFAGKISKNRLVCKNAVALAYYGSCRLLVMGSWLCLLSLKTL